MVVEWPDYSLHSRTIIDIIGKMNHVPVQESVEESVEDVAIQQIRDSVQVAQQFAKTTAEATKDFGESTARAAKSAVTNVSDKTAVEDMIMPMIPNSSWTADDWSSDFSLVLPWCGLGGASTKCLRLRTSASARAGASARILPLIPMKILKCRYKFNSVNDGLDTILVYFEL